MHHQFLKSIVHCLTVAAIAGTAAVAATPLPVPNGSFEQGDGSQPDAWVWTEPSGACQAEWTEGIAHQGKRAIRVRVPGEVSPGIAWRLACTAPVAVDPGQDYIASFWLKAACDRPVKLVIDGYHGDKLVKPRMGDGRVYVRQGAVLGFGPCDWTRFERGFTVPPDVSSLRLSFTGKLGSDLLIDEVELRRGQLAYDPPATLVEGHAESRIEEKLDRGLVAVRRPEGVHVAWRLLRDDPGDVAFHLDRKSTEGQFVRASAMPITVTTDFLDTAPEAEQANGYRLCEVRDGREQELAVCPVESCEPQQAYHAIRLAWPDDRPVTDVEKVGIGDLDGDGRYDFVLKHPTGSVLLYDDYTQWKRSPDTYKIDAFTAEGKHLWRRDLGWGIEHRNWFSPIIVHDLNGDGRAEVVAKVAEGDPRNERGRVVDGPEWFAVWDGLTGKEIARAAWPSRAGFDCFNFISRNQLAVAYLDGRTPCLIVLRGTYGLMKVAAYELIGDQLRLLWNFCNANAPVKYWGQGAHFTQCADVDGDGRDELALGSMVLDDTGVPLWSTGKGHPDGLFIGEIDPAHVGLEMYNYVETRNDTGGMILVDAATGKTLWELETPTSHVHGGLCADLDPAAPGLECFGVDKRAIGGKEQIVGTWLKSAAGEPLETPTDWGFGRPTIYWDADVQKELIVGRSIRKYRGTSQWPIPTYKFVPVDLLGDWREELLEFTDEGELRIHLSTIPAVDRRVCLMQDPIYRRDIAMGAMAYHRPAMLSYCPVVQGHTPRLDTCWPAFDYDGKPAQTDGSYSKTMVTGSRRETAHDTAESRTMTAADGKTQIRLDGKTYKNFPAEEYAVRLTNLSKTEPTGIISDFRSLKLSIDKPDSANAVTVNVLRGSTCKATDFVPEVFTIEAGKEQILTTTCGRSSNDYVPFLELNLDDRNGYLFAVGWTGTWKARFANTGKAVDVELGVERTHFRLMPGETIRQPSVLVLARKNQSRRQFKTLVHRFMLDNKVPRDSKGNVIPPILAAASGGGNKTPQMMADVLQYCVDNQMPFDTYWVDAGWYGAPHEDELYSNCGPNWWKYVGDWRVNTTTHPTGDLLPIANAVHKAGLKFLLWFEPERMTDSAPILETHPEYRHGQLVDFGNPEALRWIQDTVYAVIAEHKIDVYRQDFNMDPGPVWRGMDAADRIGIAEAKHIAGMYQFLDDMRSRFPDILQENCSSGGRRIDIEMISRAHTYCRSDYYIGRKPGDTAFILGQNATLNLMPYLPFEGCEFNCVPVGDDYAAFSIISAGTVITPSDFDGGILRRKITDDETAWFKKVFDVAARMRPFYMGDFYQLTDETAAGDDVWCAWQCDRPDLKGGFAIAFRRGAAANEAQTFTLGGIDPGAKYRAELYDCPTKTIEGSELASWTVTLPPRSFQLVFYRKQ